MVSSLQKPGLLLAACVMLAGVAFAQPAVEVRVSSEEAYTNETVTIQLSILNFRRAEKPDFPEIPGCVVRGGSEQSTSFQLGRSMQNTIRYTYELVAANPGEVTIPPIAVNIDGKTLRTEPVKIRVLAGETQDLFQAEITAGTRRLYVGQNVRFTLTLYVRPGTYANMTATPADMKEYIDRAWGSFGNFRYNGRARQVQRPGKDGREATFYAYEYFHETILEQPGPLPFSDVLVGIDYPKFERDPLGGWRVGKYRKLRTRPGTRIDEVLPLPSAGRPATFSGAVGAFRLNVSARPTNVRVGDPIELTMSLTGAGPLETLPPPNLQAQPRLVEAFRVPDEALAGRVEDGRRLFSQSIRARRSDVTEIPPIEFAYFDPDRGEYAVTRSEPIPVRIEASNTLDAASLPELVPPANAAPAAVEAVDGLRGNYVDESALLRSVRPLQIWQIAAVTLAPPAFFAAAWAWGALARVRAGSPAARRRQRALSTAIERLDFLERQAPAEAARELPGVIAAYLGDRLDQSAARFGGVAAAVGALRERGATAELADRVGGVIADSEHAAFAGGAPDAALFVRMREVLNQLGQQRL